MSERIIETGYGESITVNSTNHDYIYIEISDFYDEETKMIAKYITIEQAKQLVEYLNEMIKKAENHV